MGERRMTWARSLHDVGAAAWFGGSLAGAVALNGATKRISDPSERAQVAAEGWARWSPVAAGAIAAHLLGGAALVVANRGRVKAQAGTTANTVAKTAITAAALAATAVSGAYGAALADASSDGAAAPAESATVPGPTTPDRVANKQQQLRWLQWAIPALTGVIVVLGAQQGEQQRPSQMIKGLAKKATKA